MWEAGQIKDASVCWLEGANVLHRTEEALVELNHRLGSDRYLQNMGVPPEKGVMS